MILCSNQLCIYLNLDYLNQTKHVQHDQQIFLKVKSRYSRFKYNVGISKYEISCVKEPI